MQKKKINNEIEELKEKDPEFWLKYAFNSSKTILVNKELYFILTEWKDKVQKLRK